MTTRFTNLEALVPFARFRAQRGLYDGRMTAANQYLIDICRHIYAFERERFALVLYTRDVGHHTNGWWKNPDYERCLHLSVSYRETRSGASLDHDKAVSETLARAFFGDDVRHAWLEPPYSDHGKARDVWHYRVFCDPSWAPMTPRGEVYSREDTPGDWKSFSEVHGYTPEPDQAPFLLAASEAGA